MNTSLTRTDELHGTITVEIAKEDYQDKVKDTYKQYAKQANVPGFRPGKVPMGMVRRMVGIAPVIDLVQKMLGEELQRFIEEEKLDILGEPLPVEIRDESYFDIEGKKDLDFTFDIGFAPSFDLVTDFGSPVTKYEVTIDEETLNKRIGELQERYADLEHADEVQQGDIVFGKFEQLNDAGEVNEEGFSKMVAFNPEKLDHEELFGLFAGKAKDETLTLELGQVAETDEVLMEILHIEEDELEQAKQAPLQFTIKRISRMEDAKLVPEFFKKALDDEESDIETEEAFRDALTVKMEEEFTDQVKFKNRQEIKEKLEEYHEFDYPDEFLRKYLLRNSEQTTEENVEEQLKREKDGLKWQLITAQVQKEYPETTFEQEEFETYMRDQIREMLGDNMDEEQEKQYMDYMLQNQEMSRMYFYRLLDDRLFAKLDELIEVAPQTMTASEFTQMMEEEMEKKRAEQEAEAAALAAQQEEAQAEAPVAEDVEFEEVEESEEAAS